MTDRPRQLEVIVTTPEGKIYNHHSNFVNAETVDGGLTILYNHAPIMVPLKIGILKVKRFRDDDNPYDYIAIAGGVMEVRDNVVTVIANVAERGRDIDVDRAELAKSKAESVLQNEHSSQKEMDRAKIALTKAINRIGASRLRSKR